MAWWVGEVRWRSEGGEEERRRGREDGGSVGGGWVVVGGVGDAERREEG